MTTRVARELALAARGRALCVAVTLHPDQRAVDEILADFPDLRGFEVYVCGSVKMVEAAVPAFMAQGLGEGFCHTDAFLPSPPRQTAEASD